MAPFDTRQQRVLPWHHLLHQMVWGATDASIICFIFTSIKSSGSCSFNASLAVALDEIEHLWKVSNWRSSGWVNACRPSVFDVASLRTLQSMEQSVLLGNHPNCIHSLDKFFSYEPLDACNAHMEKMSFLCDLPRNSPQEREGMNYFLICGQIRESGSLF